MHGDRSLSKHYVLVTGDPLNVESESQSNERHLMSYGFAVRSLYRKLNSFGNIKRVTPAVQASLHGHSIEMSRVEIESCRRRRRDIAYIISCVFHIGQNIVLVSLRNIDSSDLST
jgi:hypothetical protein